MSDAESQPLQRLQLRLREPEAAERLAQAWLADLLARPLPVLVDPEQAAASIHAVLQRWAESEPAEAVLLAELERLIQRLEAEAKPLNQVLPTQLTEWLEKLAERPAAPDRKLLLQVIDRGPVRELVRSLLLEALLEFGRKLSAPISGSRVGKGLGGAFGAFAGVVGAVSGELEKQVEKRASEFADLGISRVLQQLADSLCDPKRARDQAEIRGALLEGLLSLRVQDVGRDLRRQDLAVVIRSGREALRKYLADAKSVEQLRAEVERALEPWSKKSAAELLDALGIRAEVEARLQTLLIEQARAFVSGGGWARWLDSLTES
jgi:hypothetical protein